MHARKIAAGEELTYDYRLYAREKDAPCSCGSKKCRGTMYAPEEISEPDAARGRKKSSQKQRKAS